MGRVDTRRRKLVCLFVVAITTVCLLSTLTTESADACYGPCIISDIDRTQLDINQTVTVTGQVCPPAENKTIRIAFTRPDYTFVEQYILTNPITGNFSATQKLDMAGYWNIFAIDGHICDRLFAEVTDPAQPNAPSPTPSVPLNYKWNYSVIGATAATLSAGAVILYFGTRNHTRKITSLRTFVQIGLVFVLFFGIFIDHYNLPVPAAQIAPHELDISTNVLASACLMGYRRHSSVAITPVAEP